MSEDLQSVPCEDRPKFLPLFPRGWTYFRTWRTARWFMVLLVPIALSVAASLVRGRQGWEAAMLAGLGLAVAAALFVTVSSGMSSSNTGTYFRRREPARFWRDVAILSAAYLGIAVAGYFA